jgi:CelD/BcsL family acetyltransferase involved in cellulose biosynthesis
MSGPGASIQVDSIVTPQELASLEAVWGRLLEQCPYRNVFMTHPWFMTWWRHFGEGRRLQVLRFSRAGQVVGLAPLVAERTRLRYFPVRQIGFPLNGCSLQSDLIFPEHREEVFRAFVGHLERTARDWDVVFLDGISAGSSNVEMLQRAMAGRSLSLASPTTWDCLVLPVRGDWASYQASLPANLRKNLRVSDKRLQSLGKVTYRRFDRPEEMDEAFAVLVGLERRSWKYTEGQAITRNNGFVDFFRDLATLFSPGRNFQVRVIEVDGEAIAVIFVVVDAGTVYALKSWYDQRHSHASPGRAVFHYMVEDVWDSGVSEIYLDRRTFFCGRYTRETRRYHTLRLFNSRYYSAGIGWLRKLSRSAGKARAPVDAPEQEAAEG